MSFTPRRSSGRVSRDPFSNDRDKPWHGVVAAWAVVLFCFVFVAVLVLVFWFAATSARGVANRDEQFMIENLYLNVCFVNLYNFSDRPIFATISLWAAPQILNDKSV